MAIEEERKQNPSELVHSDVFSPRFKTLAALAGWDEDSLLTASLIVDDTPDRELSNKKRSVLHFKTPPSTNSRRKRRAQRSPVSVPIVALDLDNIEATKNETQKDITKADKEEKKETEGETVDEKNSGVSTSLPCMDKLREELSCAICLDICFEPSTTPCGHSFCLKCLRFSASKCGKKCPKCRQLICNGRSCTVNTVLWNTIQLLFPQEVEAKKAASALKSREAEHCQKIPETAFYNNLRNGSPQDLELSRSGETALRRRRATQRQNYDPTASLEREIRRNIRAAIRVSSRDSGTRTGRPMPSQDGDAALALRLQREEFMGAVRGTNTTSLSQSIASSSSFSTNSTSTNRSVSLARGTTLNQSSNSTRSNSSFSLARANLRAMASRAITLSVRGGRQF